MAIRDREPSMVRTNAMQRIANNKPTLAERHLEYNLVIERNRAVLTNHAMTNTEILFDLARDIAANNPATTDALKSIMNAYLTATTENIRDYGKLHTR